MNDLEDAPLGLDRWDRVIDLMALGLTDAAIAQRLRVSERTVRREVSALLAQLGVRSRFQAGMALARVNWGDG